MDSDFCRREKGVEANLNEIPASDNGTDPNHLCVERSVLEHHSH